MKQVKVKNTSSSLGNFLRGRESVVTKAWEKNMIRRRKGRSKSLRPLTRKAKRARARTLARFRVQKPGTVVLGREGRVQYPYMYVMATVHGKLQWIRAGQLYQE